MPQLAQGEAQVISSIKKSLVGKVLFLCAALIQLAAFFCYQPTRAYLALLAGLLLSTSVFIEASAIADRGHANAARILRALGVVTFMVVAVLAYFGFGGATASHT